jgi:hypothetical protein
MSPTHPKTKSPKAEPTTLRGGRDALVQRRHAAHKARLLRIGALVVVAIVVFIVLIWITRSVASPFGPNDGLPGQFFVSQGHCHVGQDCPGPVTQYENFAYNSDPPTSGPHEEVFPSSLILEQPINKRMLVHLLEHGNVALLYSDKAPQDVVQKLKDYATAYDHLPADAQAKLEPGQAVFVAPYPGLAQPVALAAWTRLETLAGYDQAQIDAFVKAWIGNQQNAQQ